jgi:hypothetical protein
MSNMIDMNNRRQYQYLQTPHPYKVEVLSVADGDVIILHLSKDLDFDEMSHIRADVQKCFPNNQVICANEHILESISIIKKETNPFSLELDLGSINLNLEELL